MKIYLLKLYRIMIKFGTMNMGIGNIGNSMNKVKVSLVILRLKNKL